MGYLMNFTVYVLAMLGVIMTAVLVFKYTNGVKISKSGNGGKCGKLGNGLRVIDTLSLNPRKRLYVVEAGDERFLIAGDTERTTLISKLEAEKSIPALNIENHQRVQERESDIGIHTTNNMPYESVMRRLAEKIRQ